MEAYTVSYSTQAINDLRGIYAYISYDLSSPINAKKQTTRIREAIRKLDLFPSGHPIVDFEPWQSMGMRKLPVDNYVVFFFVTEDTRTVDISRIFYGGRNIEAIAKKSQPTL